MNPENGQVNFTDTTLGANATYTCDEGLSLEGVDTRTCEADGDIGEWSDSEPTCESGICSMYYVHIITLHTIKYTSLAAGGVEIARISLLVMTILVIVVLGSV